MVRIIKELPYNFNWKNRSETKYIVMHHIAARVASVQDINTWHLRDNGWSGGIGYHLYIRKNGDVYEGRPLDVIGAHTRGWNHHSVGIALEGDFMQEYPSIHQIASAIEAIRHVKNIYGNIAILKHKDCNNDTTCPGIYFAEKIITEGKVNKMEQKHWCEDIYTELVQKYELKITERRFDEPIKRGEVFALLKQVMEKIQK